MIVLDTSALVAILGREADALQLANCAACAGRTVLSAGTAIELSIVVRTKWGDDGMHRLQAILADLNTETKAVDEDQVRFGIEAHRRFGRGSGSPARLNFGDCFAYALARALGAPLLFKGDDFVHTDIVPALPA